jgi:hypothetical protein
MQHSMLFVIFHKHCANRKVSFNYYMSPSLLPCDKDNRQRISVRNTCRNNYWVYSSMNTLYIRILRKLFNDAVQYRDYLV